MDEISRMKKKVRRYLDDSRYEHTIGVMHTMGCLAMRYGADLQSALVAGLLHDCAKGMSSREKLKMCKKYRISVSEAEMANPGLLHAKLGAFLARKVYHVEDRGILRAIAAHTTGRPAMSLLDKLLYVADYIEPGRCEAPNLPEVRALAFTDLDECLYTILRDSLSYLNTKGAPVDPMTEKTYQFYRQLRDVKQHS